jgi:hypothetical protein
MSDRNRTVHFRFANLPDGDYRFLLKDGSIQDIVGNASAGELSLQDGSTFILAGDASRNRRVDFEDLLLVAKNYGQSGKTFSQGNVDASADGFVGFSDLLLVVQRYGVSLFSSAPIVAPGKSRARAGTIDLLA